MGLIIIGASAIDKGTVWGSGMQPQARDPKGELLQARFCRYTP